MIFLAAEDIVHHLLDYEGSGLTAHQYLLIAVAIFTTVLFIWLAKRTRATPPKKGVAGLLEFTLV